MPMYTKDDVELRVAWPTRFNAADALLGTVVWLTNESRHRQSSSFELHASIDNTHRIDILAMEGEDRRSVLITGCSNGSLGAALAIAFHQHGNHRVLAAARNVERMTDLKNEGIEIFELDVTSDTAIKALIDKVSSLTSGKLDMLINSVGGGHYMPFYHLDLTQAKALFDVNVWGFVAVTQAFLPLLMASASRAPKGRKSVIINNTSISSVLRTPYHSVYGASKAAMAAFNDAQRIELAPFGIRVVDLKTGSLESNFQENKNSTPVLPADSPYQPIKDEVMKVITGDATEAYAEDKDSWAKNVVRDLLKNPDDPPAQIWRGGMAGTIQLSSRLDGVIPASTGDQQFRSLGGLDKLTTILRDRDQA